MKANQLNVIVGENIRQARKRAGLSQARLAQLVGCQQPLVSRIETGVVSCTLEVLIAVSRATDTAPALLLPADEGWQTDTVLACHADTAHNARTLVRAGLGMLDRLADAGAFDPPEDEEIEPLDDSLADGP